MGYRTVVVILPDGSVTQGQLADASVGPAQLEDEAVGTDQLAPQAVTGPKIAPKAVGTGQIADHAVGKAQLDPDALDNSAAYGVLVATSDPDGLVSWSHGLGSSPSAVLSQVADTTPGIRLTVAALSASQATFRAYDLTTGDPAASTAVNAYVWAVR